MSTIQAASSSTSTTTALATQPARHPVMERVHKRAITLFDSCLDHSPRRGHHPNEETGFVQLNGFIDGFDPHHEKVRGGYDRILAYVKENRFKTCKTLARLLGGSVDQFLVQALDILDKESERLRAKYEKFSREFVGAVMLIGAVSLPGTSLQDFEKFCKETKEDIFKECRKNPSGGLYQDLERLQQLLERLTPFGPPDRYTCRRIKFKPDSNRTFLAKFHTENEITSPEADAMESYYEDLREFILIQIDYLNVLIHHANQFWTLLDNVPVWLKKFTASQEVLHPTIGEKNTLLVWDYC